MNLQQITDCLTAGKSVYWKTRRYRVVKSPDTDNYLVCHENGQCFALTGPDGKTMLCSEFDFATL